MRLIENSMSGVFNIGSGVSSSSRDVASKFLSILGADEDLIVLEPFDEHCDVIGSLPVVSGDQFHGLMGHAPMSLSEGLDHAFREYEFLDLLLLAMFTQTSLLLSLACNQSMNMSLVIPS